MPYSNCRLNYPNTLYKFNVQLLLQNKNPKCYGLLTRPVLGRSSRAPGRFPQKCSCRPRWAGGSTSPWPRTCPAPAASRGPLLATSWRGARRPRVQWRRPLLKRRGNMSGGKEEGVGDWNKKQEKYPWYVRFSMLLRATWITKQADFVSISSEF